MNTLNRPPTLEELMTDDRLRTPSVSLFLTKLLKSSKHSVTRNILKLVDSYSCDFIHSASKEEILTPKHLLLCITIMAL